MEHVGYAVESSNQSTCGFHLWGANPRNKSLTNRKKGFDKEFIGVSLEDRCPCNPDLLRLYSQVPLGNCHGQIPSVVNSSYPGRSQKNPRFWRAWCPLVSPGPHLAWGELAQESWEFDLPRPRLLWWFHFMWFHWWWADEKFCKTLMSGWIWMNVWRQEMLTPVDGFGIFGDLCFWGTILVFFSSRHQTCMSTFPWWIIIVIMLYMEVS